jgi:hypothetical protein
LGFTIQGSTDSASGGIKPSLKKLKAVLDWEIPKNVRHVQSFLGFTNFYRRFIKDYASIASPLYNLTGKGVPYHWSSECNHAFRTLKKCLTSSPLLVTPRTGPNESFVISTDASAKGIGAVLLQEQPDGSLRPCCYYAKTLNKAQRKYPVYDQELLAIAASLNEYRIYIEGCASFVVLTDHRPLIHLPTQPNIGRRHVPWVSVLSQYMGYMKIVYRKGSENDSDALSRREDLENLTEESIISNPILQKKFEEYDAGIFESDLEDLRESLMEMTHLQCDKQMIDEICNGYLQDSSFNGSALPAGVICDSDTGLYWLTDKVYVPNIPSLKSKLIEEFHNTAGHPDHERTHSVILRSFYWPNLRKDVKSFVKLCVKCQKIKPRTDKPYGSSMPLPVPTRPWDSVSMDFITSLPNVDVYDAILTVVCTLQKWLISHRAILR